jgi:hypothetical protein
VKMHISITPHKPVWVADVAIVGWVLWDGSNPREITGYALGLVDPKHFQEETVGAAESQLALTAPDQLEAQLLESKFKRLRAQWERECGITSIMAKIIMADAYQQIMSMGPDVIPLILRELQSEGDDPDWWFWALEKLTGQNPVPANVRGNNLAMANAWLEWARGTEYARELVR